ncbi:wax ester/triacylglycerol synthase family O-acyltransferase [Spongisporangium articulatum]|uniref:Diacylglycerol O-acyltransferase n=1 Tax=Spongisporangium articulatum TaxID=3362603 RepID=A0ABW8AJZ0_9ACTN
MPESNPPSSGDRLSTADVSFLYLEQPTTAMHVGTVMVFRTPDGGLDVERLMRHIGSRIVYVPRYRQRVKQVPGRLANPVWVDDDQFDLSYHVRRSALPRPGDDEQLADLVARLQSRPLDRRRPLWEVYVVEGLSDGRFALVSKVHQALVDGESTVDIGQVVLDSVPDVEPVAELPWAPRRSPNGVQLVLDAVADSVSRPGEVLDVVRHNVSNLRDVGMGTLRTAGRVAGFARRLSGVAPASPLTTGTTPHRRFAMVDTDLEDYRVIRAAMLEAPAAGLRPHAVTVNDVILSVLAGALRAWLLTRAEPVGTGSVVRTLVPMSVRDDVGPPGGDLSRPAAPEVGNRVTSFLIDLPTGEASPVMRLHQVAYQTRAHRDAGRAVDAAAIAGMAGFAPPTLHSLGARVAAGLSRRMFHLVVTNVPGPQHALYADGCELLSTYPVIPLADGQSLSIGLTSYAGRVFYGLNADREALPDLDVVGSCIRDALAELRAAVGPVAG